MTELESPRDSGRWGDTMDYIRWHLARLISHLETSSSRLVYNQEKRKEERKREGGREGGRAGRRWNNRKEQEGMNKSRNEEGKEGGKH